MSEESKPIAPGGASPVCEVCGKETFGEYTRDLSRMGRCWRSDCWQTGYDRLRASLSTAEKALEEQFQKAVRQADRADALEKALQEAEAAVEQLVGDVQTVARDYTDALNALRGVEWGGEAGFWEEASCPECREGERSGHRAGCKLSAALYGSDTPDAPTAPKASEIASDSSALEKALGALRAAADSLLWAGSALMHSWAQESPADKDAADAAYAAEEEARAALSGGAHVDGPKAPKEEVK